MVRPAIWGFLAGLLVAATASHAQSPRLLVSGSDAGYADPQACAACHREIAATYARTGMARTFGAVRAETPIPEASFLHTGSAERFTLSRRGGKPILRREVTGLPGSVLEKGIHYWLGSGNHGRGYAHRTSAGKLVELPVTWYPASGGSLAMSPGFDRPDHAGFSRKLTYQCLFCHGDYPEIEPGADSWDGAWQFPGTLPEGIGCQRCHGPGRAHVDAVRAGKNAEQVRSAIVNPARLPQERKMEVCFQCHLETTSLKLPGMLLRPGRGIFSYRAGGPLENYILHFDHAPGTGHDDKFEFVGGAYRLRKSPCFTQSRGALTCTSCHNPHDVPRGAAAVAHYDKACRSCHETKLGTMASHRQARNCAGCHMPKRSPSDAIRETVADHWIRKRPETVPQPTVELNDSNTPPYRGDVVLYYPPSLPSTPMNDLLLAVAQVKHQANLEKGIPRLDALIRQHRPQEAAFYFELGEALRQAGRLDDAIVSLEEAVRRAPRNWGYFQSLGSALSAAGHTGRALDALQRAAALAPAQPEPWKTMGEVHSQLGQVKEAAEMARKAIAVDPDFAEARNNLGTALLRLGDLAGAEAAIREAVRLRPEIPALYVNLASVVSRRGALVEAKQYLERALRLNPKLGVARRNLAALEERMTQGNSRKE